MVFCIETREVRQKKKKMEWHFKESGNPFFSSVSGVATSPSLSLSGCHH